MKQQWWKPALIFYAKVTGWIIVPLVVALAFGRFFGFSDHPVALGGALLASFGISTYGILRSARDVKDLLK